MISRIIQAIGAGILLPLMQFTVFTLFPAEQRGFAMGLAGVVAKCTCYWSNVNWIIRRFI